MKRNLSASFINKEEPSKNKQQPAQSKYNYLRAIHPSVTNKSSQEKELALINPDRVAALRYIKESAFLRKFYLQKMSC